MTATALVEIDPGLIDAGDNDRTVFEDQPLLDLVSSIAAHGLIQPLTVRPTGERFTLIAGERRFRAWKLAEGSRPVPCMIDDCDDMAASARMLAENMLRANLDPMDEANAYQKRVDAGWSLDDIATAAGTTKGQITWRLRLLRNVPEIQHMVSRGQLPVTAAAHLSDLDGTRQIIALRKFAEKKMELDDFRDLCGAMLLEQQQESLDLFGMVNETWSPVARTPRKLSPKRLLADLVAAYDEGRHDAIPTIIDQARRVLETGK